MDNLQHSDRIILRKQYSNNRPIKMHKLPPGILRVLILDLCDNNCSLEFINQQCIGLTPSSS